jgi:hypothetical protein
MGCMLSYSYDLTRNLDNQETTIYTHHLILKLGQIDPKSQHPNLN